MGLGFRQLVYRWLVLALGVLLATRLFDIHCDDGLTLFVVVVLLSAFNTFLKPLLVLFTLPFILVTMGVGVIVINALLFYFVGKLVTGFHVGSFGSALGGSLVVSITNMVASRFISPPKPPAPPRPPRDQSDVIDV